MTPRSLGILACAGALAVLFGQVASAQETIKIGELNSYKSQTAFLDPYKKGWEMAIEEINAKGGVLGKKLEVISRDDGSNPGADEWPESVHSCRSRAPAKGRNPPSTVIVRSPSSIAAASRGRPPINRDRAASAP